MAKKKNAVEINQETGETVVTEPVEQTPEQAGENMQNFANRENDSATQDEDNQQMEHNPAAAPQKSSGGKGIALLALLVALGIGGAGYYFCTQKLTQIEQRLSAVASQPQAEQKAVEMPTFEVEKAQIAGLSSDYQKALERISQLEREQAVYTQQINGLQGQIQKLDNTPKADNSAWILSDANFLLNNALRKLVLDNDLDTTKSLLIEADAVLSQVPNANVLTVREAIKADLNQLSSLNEIDQNALMLRLTQLANRVDDMPMLSNEEESETATGEVSDSLQDWEKNIEKSASSFLDHFIRVSDKGAANDKAFVAPNQEIYLRENLRLRLQIATLAVPREQNALYKQSLDTVATWVRSYFDVQNESVKAFLKEVDSLAEQSIYLDTPKQLQSLTLLDQLLHKQPQKVEKMALEAEKALEQAAPEQPQPAAEQPASAQ